MGGLSLRCGFEIDLGRIAPLPTKTIEASREFVPRSGLMLPKNDKCWCDLALERFELYTFGLGSVRGGDVAAGGLESFENHGVVDGLGSTVDVL